MIVHSIGYSSGPMIPFFESFKKFGNQKDLMITSLWSKGHESRFLVPKNFGRGP